VLKISNKNSNRGSEERDNKMVGPGLNGLGLYRLDLIRYQPEPGIKSRRDEAHKTVAMVKVLTQKHHFDIIACDKSKSYL
jgi:hypothetical protein